MENEVVWLMFDVVRYLIALRVTMGDFVIRFCKLQLKFEK